jgi:hypothetical protein
MADNSNPKNSSVQTDILLNKNLGSTGDNVTRMQQLSEIGPASSAIGDSFFGINHRQVVPAIPINRDRFGLTFFTRPMLNLSTENLREHRLFAPMLSNQEKSLPRVLRNLLDYTQFKAGLGSSLVDPNLAFIAPLSNHILSMAGWPDMDVPTFTSSDGLYKEAYSMADGIVRHLGTYDITATFRNLPGDPITALFYFWCLYQEAVFTGELVPYPDMIWNNEIDYNTRIYRLVLDDTKTKVQKIAACGAAFPLNAPTGAAFNYESERPLNQSNDQITVNFRCIGAMYFDDILVDEFNRTQAFFNGCMKASAFTYNSRDKSWSNQYYVQVPIEALTVFNNRGYPRIDPDTYELQWWVDKDLYNYRLPVLQQKQQLYYEGA